MSKSIIHQSLKMLLLRHKSTFKNIVQNVLPSSWKSALNGARRKTYEIVFPQEVNGSCTVPDHIRIPCYVSGEPEPVLDFITAKSPMEIEMMRNSCRIAKLILNAAEKLIRIGISTEELDLHLHDLIIQQNAYPSPLGFDGFPKSICTSVNNVVAHGIPDNRPLLNGDIITVDVSVYHQGFHGDCAATFLVGDVDEKARYLVSSTEEIVLKTIEKCKPGEPRAVIAETISALSKEKGLCVIPAVCGHGIGRHFHEPPQIVHDIQYVDESDFTEHLFPGMIFTIEPVIGEGKEDLIILKDGWTVVTEDDSRGAQFEHTVLITQTGAEILTK